MPIGLIQSAIGGSQIEAWMSAYSREHIKSHLLHLILGLSSTSMGVGNETLSKCKDQSLTGGAVPECAGRLYYGMVSTSHPRTRAFRRGPDPAHNLDPAVIARPTSCVCCIELL